MRVHVCIDGCGPGREPGPSAAQHFKRTGCITTFQSEEFRNKAVNGEDVLSADFLIKCEFEAVYALGLLKPVKDTVIETC